MMKKVVEQLALEKALVIHRVYLDEMQELVNCDVYMIVKSVEVLHQLGYQSI